METENISGNRMAPVEPFDEDLMVNTGSLVVFVLDAGGAIPISGAQVRIYNSGTIGGPPVAELTSGESGKTEVLYLATPPVSVGEIPDRSPGIYALYDVVVTLDGYYDVVSRNIPVYPQVLSIQPVYMVPMTRINRQIPAVDSGTEGGG